MSIADYSARMRAAVTRTPVWQIAPTPDEHIRELLSEPGGMAAAAGAHPGFRDHGGSTLRTPRLVLIDFGPWWGDTSKRNQFAAELMTFGYLSKLSNYGSGNGTFWGAVTGPTLSGDVTDQQIQDGISALIAAGKVPKPDGNTLYAACLPDGVSVLDANNVAGNCAAYCGYHSAIDPQTFYSVQPSTLCNGCHGTFEPFIAFLMVLAHEVAEACTDAWPGSGWYLDDTNDSMNGAENADLEAWIAVKWGPWIVQGYYTNEEGNTVGPYVPVVVPQPNPTTTTVVLASSPATQPVQFNVTVVGRGSPGPTGSVMLYDGTALIAGGPLVQGGFSWAAQLPVGAHSISARYAGDAANKPSVSQAISVTVPAPVSDYSRFYSLFDWTVKNYGSTWIDALEKLDPAPADVAILERWRAAGHEWGFW